MLYCYIGSVSIVRRFDSPKIQLKLKLALTLTLTLTDTGGAVLTLTNTGDLRTIEPSDYRADTITLHYIINATFCLQLCNAYIFPTEISGEGHSPSSDLSSLRPLI